MADPSLIERLRELDAVLAPNGLWSGKKDFDREHAKLKARIACREAASTLEDQARLIGECRDVVKRLLAIITPGQGLKFRDEVIDASLLLTKLKASVDGATK